MPPTAFFPLLFPVFKPSSIPAALTDNWEIYLLLFGVPWALGVACWILARRSEHKWAAGEI